MTGNYDEALGSYKEALKAAERSNNLLAKSVALGNISLIYKNKGEAEIALEYHQKALDIFKSIGAPHLVQKVKVIIDNLKGNDKST